MEEDGECGECLRSDHVLWGTALCRSSANRHGQMYMLLIYMIVVGYSL